MSTPFKLVGATICPCCDIYVMHEVCAVDGVVFCPMCDMCLGFSEFLSGQAHG